ncbi:MAG: NUDIX hydrolase [Deltaproteobacteria bacterium]|nr:NUDIX hydrolase [Deltaproteobacteria bacterium]
MDTLELVAGLIIRGNRLLLVHNVKHNGFRVEPPGGKRHGNETREEAVAREVMEETGLSVHVGGLFGVYSTHSPEGSFNVYMYVCDAPKGEPAVMEPHLIGGLGWYSYDEIEALAASGALVPNMVAALMQLRALLDRGDG